MLRFAIDLEIFFGPHDLQMQEEGQDYVTFTIRDRYNQVDVTVKISTQDATEVLKHRWHVTEKGYINSFKQGKLHKFIWKLRGLGIPSQQTLDHINLDKSDNRIENLRTATGSQQRFNSAQRENTVSGYRGVRSDGKSGWSVNGNNEDGKQVHIGNCKDKLEGAEMFDRWSVFCPDFESSRRTLNFPEKLDYYKSLGPLTPRVCSREFHGVEADKYLYVIKIKGKPYGRYVDKEEAARVRDDLIVEMGLQSKLNFPERHPNHRKKVKMLLAKREGDVAFVWIANAGIAKTGAFLKLDFEDYERCKWYRVSVDPVDGYLSIRTEDKTKRIARYVLGVTDSELRVIYKDNDRCNCCKSNLEIVTQSEMTKYSVRKKKQKIE